MPAALLDDLSAWYLRAGRDLPWRRAGTSAFAVLVSEVMLQQTPVARVVPVFESWMQRWPSPSSLADDEPGEAVRAWGRLGYPRRALRLHAAAVAVVERHGGQLPSAVADLLALPGVGDYTARAVAAFAFGQRTPVVDTNVRRVVARILEGVQDAAVRRSDLALVEALLPADPASAALASIALMELGALVCTARTPSCSVCPVRPDCAWDRAGRPDLPAPVRRPQGYAGTDRQVRGRLLGLLRDADGPLPADALDRAWDEPVQRQRALDSLLADGLVQPGPDGGYALPGRPVRTS